MQTETTQVLDDMELEQVGGGWGVIGPDGSTSP